MLTALRGYMMPCSRTWRRDRPRTSLRVAGETVARDLRDILEITSQTPSLTQAITDEMVPQNARRAVMVDLFSAESCHRRCASSSVRSSPCTQTTCCPC